MPSAHRSLLPAILACITACVLCAWAEAQSVVARVATQDAYVNEPLRLALSVQNVEDFDGPIFEEVADLEIKRLPGEQTSTSIQTVNGRTTQQRTVSMTFEVTARRAGEFVIPAFTITAGGATYASKPIPIRASVPKDSDDLLVVRVTGTPSAVYIGQRGGINLELCIKRYSDAGMGITLDEASMWSLVDLQGSTWGVFTPALQKMLSENRRPRGELRMVDDTECYVYTIAKDFDPIAVGTPSVGEVRVRMEYPTKLQRGSDFFMANRLSVAAARTLNVVPRSVDVSVLPIPEGGRPKSWNGAVGDFEVLVVAKPLDVAVGDPITLTMRVTDRSASASLEGLQAPVLAQQPAFTTAFRVPSEAAAGTVEGRSKVFTQSIRALGEGVKEIPPIELAFFDPARGEFRTARSGPIALNVRPSAIVRVDAPDPGEGEASAKPTLTTVAGGLVANMSVDDVRSNRTASLGQLALTVGVVLALTLLPVTLSSLLRRVDPRSTQRTLAMSRLEQALASSPQPEAVEAALLQFTSARLGLTGAGFSRKDACDALARAGVDAGTIEQTDRFLRECERARYVGGEITREQAVQVARMIETGTKDIRFTPSGSAA